MNKKGEMNQVGTLIAIFLVIIVGIVVVVQATAPSIASLTQTSVVINETVTFPANGANLTLKGQAASSVILINGSSGTVVPANNFTVTNYKLVNGQLVSHLTSLGGTWGSINASYTNEPFGYQTGSGNRAVISLIQILGILAIVGGVLAFIFKDKLLDFIDV